MAKPEPTIDASDPLAGLSEQECAEHIAKIKEGLKAAEEGRFVSDAHIEAIIKKFEMNA